MAVRGWVAEKHLADYLRTVDGVTECEAIEVDGRPDLSVRWRDGPSFSIECKNASRTTLAGGIPKVDFQRTRAAKGDSCSRYYSANDFEVLATCLHSISSRWEYRFALTDSLAPHKSCAGRISPNVRIGPVKE